MKIFVVLFVHADDEHHCGHDGQYAEYPVHPQRYGDVGESCAVDHSGMYVEKVELLKEEVHSQHQEEDEAEACKLA